MRTQPAKPKTLAKVPHLPHGPVRPSGPKALRIQEQYIGGYGDPPPGFIGGQNSITEWIVYFALFKIMGTSQDNPRNPPFFGLPGKFAYQVAALGTHTRAFGSAVVDFVVYYGRTQVGLRIETEHYHIFTDSRKQASDALQKANLDKNMIVIDVYDVELLGDPSGAKAIVNLKRHLQLVENLDPILAGHAIRGSRLRIIQ